MVAKINRGVSLYGAVIYNQRKVDEATARNDGDADRYIQAGFAGCIHKPFYTRDCSNFSRHLLDKTELWMIIVLQISRHCMSLLEMNAGLWRLL